MSQSNCDNNILSKSISSTYALKRRYNNWNEEEEQTLLKILNEKNKKLNELTDNDWVEISLVMNLS
jgi:hypothetical protein